MHMCSDTLNMCNPPFPRGGLIVTLSSPSAPGTGWYWYASLATCTADVQRFVPAVDEDAAKAAVAHCLERVRPGSTWNGHVVYYDPRPVEMWSCHMTTGGLVWVDEFLRSLLRDTLHRPVVYLDGVFRVDIGGGSEYGPLVSLGASPTPEEALVKVGRIKTKLMQANYAMTLTDVGEPA